MSDGGREAFGPGTYGALHAARYDEDVAPPTAAVVEAIAGLAAGGSVLELGIGTGRVARPLARRGLRVEGIDASPEMVARLRAKPGGDAIPVAIGDFADCAVEGTFDLAILLFNTLFCLPSQEAQLRCFRNVAARLSAGGAFLVEAFVPDLARFQGGQAVRATRVERDVVTLEAVRHDPVAQRIATQTIEITDRGVRLLPIPIRYAWPSEIDLMARLAGLALESRWGGWDRSPLTAESRAHVSVYRKPRAPEAP